jgi:hypothetical protein
MTKFLEETNIIDYSNHEIQKLAKSLATNSKKMFSLCKR